MQIPALVLSRNYKQDAYLISIQYTQGLFNNKEGYN